MDIILDTNTLWSDPLLSSAYFERLKTYVIKTKSAIILPQIVREELGAVYKRELTKKLEAADKAVQELNRLLFAPFLLPDQLLIEALAETYISYIRKRLDFFYLIELEYRGEYLPELVNRALCRTKPFSEKGEEFRDALLWVNILDYLKNDHDICDKIFVSDNIRDFGDRNGHNLHEQLRNELTSRKLRLKYCRSLKDFVQNYAVKIEFITEDWLVEHFDWEPLNKRALECAEGINCAFFYEHFSRHYPEQTIHNYDVVKAHFDKAMHDFTVCESDQPDQFNVESWLTGKVRVRFYTALRRFFYKWIPFCTICYFTISNDKITNVTADFYEEETSLEL